MGGAELRTPAFVVDEGLLKRNLELLADVARRAGCKILLAQKAFSMYRVLPAHPAVSGGLHGQRPV